MTLAALLRHLAFAIGLALLSAAVVRGMIAARLLDRPDPRKVHTQATPKGGGVGVVAAFLSGGVLSLGSLVGVHGADFRSSRCLAMATRNTAEMLPSL
jgi:UDP-N-acetylmuramyl pentapeptide phosphotransferase/UDP-N-acetylglucosamine-1-phosphate transferase